jgi:hypothetical protein
MHIFELSFKNHIFVCKIMKTNEWVSMLKKSENTSFSWIEFTSEQMFEFYDSKWA